MAKANHHGWKNPEKAKAHSQAQIREIEKAKKANQKTSDKSKVSHWIEAAKKFKEVKERRAERVKELSQQQAQRREINQRYG